MDIIRIVNDIKEGLLDSGVVNEDVFIIKDEVKDIPDIHDNIQDYLAWVSLPNVSVNNDRDVITVLIGTSGVSSEDDDDYLQVVAKCLYNIRNTLQYSSYIKDEDINDVSITIDSEERENSVIVICYTSIEFEIKLANGSDV